jgi:type II secretory pathway predicted ATPase ExeA
MSLRELLDELNCPQTALAQAAELSHTATGRLVRCGQWPKRRPLEPLRKRITEFLASLGASDSAVEAALNEPGPDAQPCTGPETPAIPEAKSEVHDMLLRKTTLRPDARKAFGLARNPFDDLQSAEDMYLSPDIRYVREAMHHTARHDGFLAVVGESGAGKSTLRRDLLARLYAEQAPVIPVLPYVLGMEDNDNRGKTMKSGHIAEAIIAAVAPLATPRQSPEARFRQLHQVLRDSWQSGYRHCLIIEEAHCLPIPTLKHLKRLRELEHGFSPLISIILLGQPELATKLSEVVQRIEVVELEPVPVARVEEHLAFRSGRVGVELAQLIDAGGIQALTERLTWRTRDGEQSLLYPLAIGNLMVSALNLAAELGEQRVTADIVREV